MGEASRVDKTPWEDVIWWEAPKSNIQGTYEGDAKDAHNAWPFLRSDVDVEDMEEDWKQDPCEVEEDGEEIVLFWRRACKSTIFFLIASKSLLKIMRLIMRSLLTIGTCRNLNIFFAFLEEDDGPI